jgi:hypothetical protein
MISQREKIEDSINRAIDFLSKNQLPWGEFKTYASWNPWFFGSVFDSSPFVTTFVLYCLKDIQEERVKKMTKKALDFLSSEQEKGGIWRFWTKRNKKKLPADLDDISTVSFILKMNNVSFDDNLQLILNNRNKDGLFLTWLMDEKYKKSIFWRIVKENVDCVVNSNVLLYLGKNDSQVCSYINQIINSNQFRSIYYPSKLALFYAVSRAFKNNITCLGKSREKILKSILSLAKKPAIFGNDLETALALNTLFNFNYSGKEIDFWVGHLLKRQLKNGSWKKAVFFLGPPFWFLATPPRYRYYGSEELTTAFCLEALKNYQRVIKNGTII